MLRMLGVDGLDRSGRPLAASMAERYCGSDRMRLARGVLLPFTIALHEYDCPAHELALDVASGDVDLGMEAALLERPDRLATAEKAATGLIVAALARFDANRTAAREMRDVLGLPDEPWLGVDLRATEAEAASIEVRRLVGSGVDVIRVHVPASWEFAEARRHAGLDTPDLFDSNSSRRKGKGQGRLHVGRLRPAQRGPAADPAASAAAPLLPVPAGSQRGLAALRLVADQASAARGCYASLMTITSAFAAPEQAVVAAFERIDYVAADPMREIVEENVNPERALADHAFAHRLQARAGSRVLMGAGPLALGADLASGIPPDAATRSGRGLALQALNVELALADGLPADRIYLGAVPDWVAGEGSAARNATTIVLEAWLRRLVFPGRKLVLSGTGAALATPGGIAGLVAALAGGEASLVIGSGTMGSLGAADLEAAASAARATRATLGDGRLHGAAAEFADQTLQAASRALDQLAAEGWESLLGPVGQGDSDERIGGSAVVERADDRLSGARFLTF